MLEKEKACTAGGAAAQACETSVFGNTTVSIAHCIITQTEFQGQIEGRVTPLKAVRLKCLDCCAGSAAEVRLCPSQSCPLWPFRIGHNPNRARIGGNGFTENSPDSTAFFEGERAREET